MATFVTLNCSWRWVWWMSDEFKISDSNRSSLAGQTMAGTEVTEGDWSPWPLVTFFIGARIVLQCIGAVVTSRHIFHFTASSSIDPHSTLHWREIRILKTPPWALHHRCHCHCHLDGDGDDDGGGWVLSEVLLTKAERRGKPFVPPDLIRVLTESTTSESTLKIYPLDQTHQ